MSKVEISHSVTKNYELQLFAQIPRKHVMVDSEMLSDELLLYGLFKFQIRVELSKNFVSNTSIKPGKKFSLIFVKSVNVSENNYTSIRFSSKILNFNKLPLTPDSIWHLISDTDSLPECFDLRFTVEMGRCNIKPKILYDELTDFELRGDDGSVKVHKCVLAAASPVLKSMVLDDWKDVTDEYVEIKGISKATLEDMKTYIYSQQLPTTVSEQLLTLAMQYMMPDMETACINNLIQNTTPENLSNLFNFAGVHKNKKLKVAILEYTRNKIIDIDLFRNILIEKDNENVILIPTCKSLEATERT